MKVDAAIAHLQSLGLYVERHVPGGMTDRSSTDGVTVARELHDDRDPPELVDACFIFPLHDRWVYRNWNGIGGRAPDDVHIDNLSLDTAVQYAECFYFGVPLVIDGWSFPVNQHPEWNVDLLRESYCVARTLTNSAWRRVRGERHAESKGINDAQGYLLKFREVESVDPRDDARLWMRNDLAEMFLVRSP